MDPEKVITHLLKQTQAGSIAWTRTTPFEYMNSASDDHVDMAFIANHGGQSLAIYEERFKSWMDEDTSYWDARVVLDVVDGDHSLVWRFPPSMFLRDLLAAASYSAANVPKIFDDLMSH